jgi:hypothetical protein
MTENKPTCPCGRSPIGSCMGWHALSEEDFQKKLAEWNEKNGKSGN